MNTKGYIVKHIRDNEPTELVIYAVSVEHAEHLAETKYGIDPTKITEIGLLNYHEIS